MIHKFISNDNKGNVNTLEIGSDYTKISKVVDPVNDDDVANKKYVDQAAGKFIVTLTPTSPDYSGTMDKTVAEINAAYEAGMDVWFSVNGGQAYVPLNIASFSSGDDYPSFECYLVNPNIGTGVIMYAYTQFTSDGTKQTYSTKVYSLTPAS